MPLASEQAVALPKVLLRDRLDGGLRVGALLELADAIRWRCGLLAVRIQPADC